jgi:transposase
MQIHTIGVDLAKTIFHLVGVNARGEVVMRKKCSRNQLLRFTSNLREVLIGMEACGGFHFLGRAHAAAVASDVLAERDLPRGLGTH